MIQEGQKVHPSVWRSRHLGDNYVPRARLRSTDVNFWADIKLRGGEAPNADGTETNPWREVDLYDLVEHLVRQYTKHKSVSNDDTQRAQLEALRTHSKSGLFESFKFRCFLHI